MVRLPSLLAASAVLALASAGTLLVVSHQQLDSATMDEPFHALASAEYAISGTYWANLEHPPVAKLLAGASMAAAGVREPRIPRPFSFATAETPHSFVFANDVPPDRLLAAARRPFPVLFALLVLLAAVVAAREAGALAALATAAFLAFEPTFVAHAAYLHTDVPAALGLLVTFALAVGAADTGRRPLWAATGAAWGLSMATKFSMVLAGPVILVVILLRMLQGRGAGGDSSAQVRRQASGLLLAAAVAIPVVLAAYAPAMRSMTREEAARSASQFMSGRGVAPETIPGIAALSRALPAAGHFAAGLLGVAAQNRIGGGVNFLRGRLSVDGFWDYFPVAFLVKSSLGFLGLLLAGAAALALLVRRRMPAGLLVPAAALAAAVLFAAASGSSYNIGVRHLLPAVPLLVLAAVVSVVRAVPPRTAAGILVPLALLQAVETARVHPHEISFFNAFVGGPANGEAWLSDSNVDWGQDLRRLAARAAAGEFPEERLTVAYFGGDSPAFRMPRARLFQPAVSEVSPGLYAISSFLLACGPEFLAVKGDVASADGIARLRRALSERGEHVGRVGYSIGIFRLREEGTPLR